ncbi:MAG: AraC family transcriptional regulator [Rhodospirillaceae bacterium]|nr:AraC family transcriptional regulator [Rhodospirillaceae bacterium]
MTLQPIRFETAAPFALAGLNQSYSFATMNDIPEQWDRMQPYLGTTPNQIGKRSYGVCHNMHSGGFDYFAGVQVANINALPPALAALSIPGGLYAVFAHTGPITAIRDSIDAAWTWLKTSGRQPAGPAMHMEVYLEDWAHDKDGNLELWTPVKP